ncbi:hypothetical protein ACHHYP_13695 [Achlya hypogyna]|uniref:Uncharacterized protein n=1 Tax=Achlya hypogyna TaxID=1202772 RepID=A0A1V9YEW6_ACHHY|nr:hypothetical protein ACHHYP_13695 [Achlya hypogyna]
MKGRNTPRSRITQFEVRLQQILTQAQAAPNELFGKERRVKACLTLAEDVVAELGLHAPLLRTLLGELKRAIFSDEAIARHFADAGVFHDEGSPHEMQERAAFKGVPCFVLLDIAYRERTRLQAAEKDVAASEARLWQHKRSLLERERDYRGQLDDTYLELLASQDRASHVQAAYDSLSEETREYTRDMKAAMFAMQRELQAMHGAIVGYQAEIRDLQIIRDKTDLMRKQFEAIDGQLQHRTAAAPKELRDLEQALHTELQLLLLRNERIAEYDHAVRFCPDDALVGLRESFLRDVGSVLDEHACLQAYAPPLPLEPSLVALLAPAAIEADSVLWTPFLAFSDHVVPKKVHRLSLDELERFLNLVWGRIALAERKCDKLVVEYEVTLPWTYFVHFITTTHKRAALIAIEGEPTPTLPEVVFAFALERYGDKRVAVLCCCALLQAVDEFAGESPQIELFGSAFAGQVDQSAWWYLMRLKAHVADVEVEITDDKALRLVGQHLLSLEVCSVIQDHVYDGFVANVRLNTKGVLTSRTFFDWLAKRIGMADDFHFKRVTHLLAAKGDSAVVPTAAFVAHVVESARLVRAMIGRFLRFASQVADAPSTDEPAVPVQRAMYMLSYLQLKYNHSGR